jgi:hypothetical protein
MLWLLLACHHDPPPCETDYTGAIDTGVQHDGVREEGNCATCVASLDDHCANDPEDCPRLPGDVVGCSPVDTAGLDTNGTQTACGDVTRVDCSYESLGSKSFYFRANHLVGIHAVSSHEEYCRSTSDNVWYGEVSACVPE